MLEKQKSFNEILPKLPRYSYSLHKRQMEPVTLILVGQKSPIIQRLESAGWYGADKISLLSSLKAGWASLADSTYRQGPMWSGFIAGKRNDLAFEKPTSSDSYRRRHHLRIWKTVYKIQKQPVWIGTISYDKGVGVIKHTLIPAHHISPRLDMEDEYLARTLHLLKPLYVKLAEPQRGVINTGDPYIWNGKALVLECGLIRI